MFWKRLNISHKTGKIVLGFLTFTQRTGGTSFYGTKEIF